MKLTIWQQFSSNHSASFTVVGQFANENDAKKASTRLAEMLKAVYLQSMGYEDKEPLQAELDIAQEFDIEWKQHLDWVHESEGLVHQFDNYVIVSNIMVQTYCGAIYIDKILAKLGADVYAEEEIGKYAKFAIGVDLKCSLADAERMSNLYKSLNDYLIAVRAEREHLVKPPWRNISERLYKFNEFNTSDAAWFGFVHLNGKELSFSRLKFASIGYGLPALLEFLKTEGCTDIEYSIAQKRFNEIWGGAKE